MIHWPDFEPDNPEDQVWDLVVVGAGMGGAVTGHSIAGRGWRVLFLERGAAAAGGPVRVGWRKRLRRLWIDEDRADELEVAGRWGRRISVRGRRRIADVYIPLGSGPGGSSAIYGASLERFRREDLAGSGDATPDPELLPGAWPISYEDLVPYYRQAETLMRVHGDRDPTDPDDDAELQTPPPLSERDRQFFSTFQVAGLAPFRLHIGIDYRPGCAECLGYICRRGCKSDGLSRALAPALTQRSAKLLTEFAVEKILADSQRASAVVGLWRGRPTTIRGRVIVLAAGALNTPLILLNSACGDWPGGIGNQQDLVGRGLMFHVGAIFALWSRSNASAIGPTRTLSSRALNLVDGVKLGGVQSFAPRVAVSQIADFLAGTLEASLPFRVPLARLVSTAIAIPAATAFRNAALFATLTEDYAYRDNRVSPAPASPSGFVIEYAFKNELVRRARSLRGRVSRALRGHRLLFLTKVRNLNFGHPCGTVRFGHSPESSVLTPDNRVRGLDNLYVTDASLFPSSAATNPGLTVAANALRVAEIIGERLSENDGRDQAFQDAAPEPGRGQQRASSVPSAAPERSH